MRRPALAAAVILGAVFAGAPRASAHPLGNFTINQYSGLRITNDAVLIDLVTDMAEIPTFQLRPDIDANGDGHYDDEEIADWRAQECGRQISHLVLKADGRTITPALEGVGALTFPPGQGGLPTLRLECPLRAALPSGRGERSIEYRNTNFDGRLGWREIVAVGDRTTLTVSDAPAIDVTDRLTHYPKDLLRSPLDERSASMRFVPGPSASAPDRAASATVTSPLPRGVDRLTRAFTDLVAERRLSVLFGLAAVGIALALGAIHALAPGHGKTVMAAYIVGERGTLRHAALIGLAVTATHTAGVVALGVVLTTSTAIAPERLYPWFGLVSGLLLASIGVTLARRALRARRRRSVPVSSEVAAYERGLVPAHAGAALVPAAHHHGDGHTHDHGHGHDHDHGHGHHDATGSAAVPHPHGGRVHTHAPVDPSLGWRSLLAVGFAGGLVPNPSALVVLLGAIALGRTWFGLLLVIAYGVGMAVTLTSAGLLLVRARGFLDRRRWGDPSGRVSRLMRFLPLVTSTIIVVAGFILAAGSVAKL